MKKVVNFSLLKKVFCLFMAVIMVFAIAGCGGGASSSETEQLGGGEYDVIGKSDKEPTLEELKAELNLPDVKITGDKVKYLCWLSPEGLSDPKEEIYHINMIMKKYYNCELEYITTTYEQLPVKAAQLVLSGESPDMIFYKSADNPGFVYNKIVQPINDHVDINSKYYDDVRDTMNDLAYDGKVYFTNGGVIANNGVVAYNKQMFEDIGEKTPLELYREGKWTWSKFRELANKLTVDDNGDGTPEVYGASISFLYIYTSCGEDFIKFAEDGTVSNNMKSANIGKMMNFMHNLGKAGDNVNLKTSATSLLDGTVAMD